MQILHLGEPMHGVETIDVDGQEPKVVKTNAADFLEPSRKAVSLFETSGVILTCMT